MNEPNSNIAIASFCARFVSIAMISSISVLSGCDRKSGSASSPAPANTSSSTPVVDWSKIQASSVGESIMTEKTIARHCDAWHKGGKPRVTLRHDGVNTLTDDAGNTMSVTAQDWKGVIQRNRDSKQPASAAASKSAMYSGGGPSPQDRFGVLPRYMYGIEVIDDATIVFRNDRKLDDGT